MSGGSRIARCLGSGVLLSVAATLLLGGCTAPGVARPSAPAAEQSVAPSRLPSSLSSSQIFPGGLYTDPTTHAADAVSRLIAEGRNDEAATILQISSQPTAIWLAYSSNASKVAPLLQKYVDAARARSKTLVFVTYAIPNRDCGGLSAGGLSSADYIQWNRTIAQKLSGTHSVILVEPDSLAMLTKDRCASERESRPPLIRQAVDILVSAGLTVYLDGGNSHWVKPDVMAGLLRSAGVAEARGFFTNVSNFYRVDQERGYADRVSKLLGGKNFVIDVSRNGNGWQGNWCNPPGAAVGQKPQVTTGATKLDALLWVKHPGDSDGACNGGPVAGRWWESYALGLVRNGS